MAMEHKTATSESAIVHLEKHTTGRGERAAFACPVCGAAMLVRELEAEAPVKWAHSGLPARDEWTCASVRAAWHVQVQHILVEMRATASTVLRDLLAAEVGALLTAKKATRKGVAELVGKIHFYDV